MLDKIMNVSIAVVMIAVVIYCGYLTISVLLR